MSSKIFILLLLSLSVSACTGFLGSGLTEGTSQTLDPGIVLPADWQPTTLIVGQQKTTQTKITSTESCTALTHSVINATLQELYSNAQTSTCSPVIDVMMGNDTDGAVSFTAENTDESGATYTKQNSQNAGVLEADTAFASDSALFVIQNNTIDIYQAWPAEDFAKLASISNAFGTYELTMQKILLKDDRLFVFAYAASSFAGGITVDCPTCNAAPAATPSGLMFMQYDVSDAASPKWLASTLYDNALFVNARLSGDVLHIFGKTDLSPDSSTQPEDTLVFDTDSCTDDAQLSKKGEAKLNAYLKEWALLLQNEEISDDLPIAISLSADGNTLSQTTLDCSQVLGTELDSSTQLLWADAVSVADSTVSDSTGFDLALLSSSDQIYMNQNHLVLYGDVNRLHYDLKSSDDTSIDGSVLNLFDLTGKATQPYLPNASGLVAGSIDSPWQIDANNDVVRVVTEVRQVNSATWWDFIGSPDRVSFYTLQSSNSTLIPVGTIESLVTDEDIYGVRYVGNQAYVVTMLTEYNWDPLFVIDTSDLANPVVLGSLEMPGFSSYLELIDDGLLLGVGYNSITWGFYSEDLKVSLYSVEDASLPTELAQYSIADTYTYNLISHLQINLDDSDGERKLFVPYQIYSDSETSYGLDVLSVADDNVTLLQHHDFETNESYERVDRSIRYRDETDDVVYVITSGDVYQIEL